MSATGTPGRRQAMGKRMLSAAGRVAFVLTAVLGVADAANAEEPEYALLAETCAACHGPGGDSRGAIPSIDTMNVEAVRVFLVGFRDGEIEATVMDRIARALTDAEIEALAHYFGREAE